MFSFRIKDSLNKQMLIGYIRVSTREQNTDLQFDTFKKFGCDKVFHEKVSGVSKDRPEFEKMQTELRPGDTILVWDISRLGRSTAEMIKVVEVWISNKISVKSIQEPFIDTSTEAGEFVIKLFIILAESERKRSMRRIKEGIAAGRARGRIGGRKKGLSPEALEKAKKVVRYYNSKQMTTEEICSAVKISRATLYKYLRHEGITLT